jgi:hypothetical protein
MFDEDRNTLQNAPLDHRVDDAASTTLLGSETAQTRAGSGAGTRLIVAEGMGLDNKHTAGKAVQTQRETKLGPKAAGLHRGGTRSGSKSIFGHVSGKERWWTKGECVRKA